ncbi:sialate O-acetylesterase [Bacteroides sp. 51]|uniref:sialate O-acetylesterase n=1 Tax=Bacteroides sp. 51 TaxID=2302938 RepID=UPI0013D84834|nr:sialate O-acetylesterase [Bacteroides sp. 51]NDV81935.1 sialate O-acetylesterase [Bacteroides sp. 51]
MVNVLFKVKIICFILCFTQLCEAKVKLPALISDGMVLQREQNIRVWGSADAGESVTVNFLKKKYTTQADAAGNWQVALPPTKAGGPYTMTINELEIKNILIGDVYLCSGQSNMELPIYRVTDMFRAEVEAYTNPMIRHIKVPLSYNFHGPQADINPADWKELNPTDAMQFSALAYFFAKAMYEKNKIPVGLINSAVGGSPVEAWISKEGLKSFSKYLNESELYQSDELIASIRNTERLQSKRWNEVLYKNDAGLHESTKWFEAGYNDSDWQRVDLFDTSWNNNGVSPVNGSHWFRKDIEIPGNQAGKAAVLRLGCIVDADSVYVNGTFVGTVSYQYPPRIYKLPEGLLKAGKNTVTVRLISYGGRPHFVPEKPYKIVFDQSEISLEGEWKYRLGAQMPQGPGQTFFQYKPAGLYNAMIAPLQNYAIKGAIWYQGESNADRYNEYYDLLTAMIADCRALLNASFPIVIVELAEFGRPDGWDTFRGVQKKVAEDTPGAAFAPAKDLGEWNDIHPLNKKDAGIRVALEMEKLINNKP